MKNILVFGDSHSEVFTHMNNQQSNFIFDVKIVGGATAYGLNNHNNKSRSHAFFIEKLKEINILYDYILIALGEVDCAYLIWSRSKKHNISLKKSTQQSIDNLNFFIKNTVSHYFNSRQIVLLGANLPAVENGSCLLSDRKTLTEVKQHHSTFLTVCYNKKLQELAQNNYYKYLDITHELMDFKTGLIQKEFCIPTNNHLRLKHVWPLWFKKLSLL